MEQQKYKYCKPLILSGRIRKEHKPVYKDFKAYYGIVNKEKGVQMEKMNIISLANVDQKSKIELLKKLGYNSDGTYVLDKGKKRVVDRYTKKPIRVANMAILPGSLIIIDENPFSLIEYLEDYKKEI